MNKRLLGTAFYALLAITLTSCSGIGDKAGSLSVVYFVTAFFALLALAGYLFGVKKRDCWMTVLFTAVLVVNCGYAVLAVSGSLGMALWANRLAYLGSVFLPLSMLMIILRVTDMEYGRWFPAVLTALGGAVFIIAASPGYSDIYYSSVSLSVENGVSVLVKEYGPLHIIFLFYLIFYAVTTASVAVYACVKKKINSVMHVIILNVAVFINIGVWFLEQLVEIEFELLSVSYVISELFLLGLSLMLEERERLGQNVTNTVAQSDGERSEISDEELAVFISSLTTLTPTERVIYDQYVAGKRAKDVMESQHITENTLKYHNKNIYGKLGVSSRKQLVETARQAQNHK